MGNIYETMVSDTTTSSTGLQSLKEGKQVMWAQQLPRLLPRESFQAAVQGGGPQTA